MVTIFLIYAWKLIWDRAQGLRRQPRRAIEQIIAYRNELAAATPTRPLACTEFPRRHVVRVDLGQAAGTWQASYLDAAADAGAAPAVRPLGQAEPFELQLAELLARFTRPVKPTRKNGRIALIRLQQRLLSSVEAFYRTLRLYARSVAGENLLSEPPNHDE